MTYRDIILTFDTLRPNTIDEECKFDWLRQLEREIFTSDNEVGVCDEVESPEALVCYVYALICNYLLLVGDVGEYAKLSGFFAEQKHKYASLFIRENRPPKARMKVDLP